MKKIEKTVSGLTIISMLLVMVSPTAALTAGFDGLIDAGAQIGETIAEDDTADAEGQAEDDANEEAENSSEKDDCLTAEKRSLDEDEEALEEMAEEPVSEFPEPAAFLDETIFADAATRQAANEAALRALIREAPTNGAPYEIKVIQDIRLTAPIQIESGQNITVDAEGSSVFTITSGAERHFETEGALTLSNIMLDGENAPGGVSVVGGSLTLNAGASIENCFPDSDGGGIYAAQGTVEINGGIVRGNQAKSNGGGIYAEDGSHIILRSGGIRGNTIAENGGGGGGIVINNADSSLTMYGGEIADNQTCVQHNGSVGGGVVLKGTFNMYDGSISGNESVAYGGGVFIGETGVMNMQGGKISGNAVLKAPENSITPSGGGVFVGGGGVFTMDDGVIEYNISNYGGGVNTVYGTTKGGVFNFNGGTIRANTAKEYGGGIFAQHESSIINLNGGVVGGDKPEDANTAPYGGGLFASAATVSIAGSEIIGNRASEFGGGIYLLDGIMNVSNSEISRNTASGNGGGIYAYSAAQLNLGAGVSLTGNTAGNQGGAIYTENFLNYAPEMNVSYDYSNLNMHSDTIFSGNLANGLYQPPTNADSFGNLLFSQTSASGIVSHPLNNFDINYVFESAIKVYSIIYHANDETAAPKTVRYYAAAGGAHEVKASSDSEIAFTRTGYTFAGWNSLANGQGTGYTAGEIIADIQADIVLYAQWKEDGGGGGSNTYAVTYDANGGQGSHRDSGLRAGTRYTVKQQTETGITHSGNEFIGWNTAKDGGGTAYAPGDAFTIRGNITLYAQWQMERLIPELNKEDHMAYIIGYPDKTVRPQANITRAETTTMFFRLLTEESRNRYWTKSNAYPDANSGDWFNNAVSTMTDAGIVIGYPDGTFRANHFITRAEFAAIAARFDSESYTGADKFSDIGAHWASEYINRAAERGWIEGYADGTFKPDQYITRAEAVTLVNRVLERDKIEEMHPDMLIWADNAPGEWYYLAIQEATNSHTYERDENGNETWTSVVPAPDWAALEKNEA